MIFDVFNDGSKEREATAVRDAHNIVLLTKAIERNPDLEHAANNLPGLDRTSMPKDMEAIGFALRRAARAIIAGGTDWDEERYSVWVTNLFDNRNIPLPPGGE